MAKAISAILAGLATVVLLTLAFPPLNWGWAIWFVLIPTLLIVPRLSTRGTEWYGFLTGTAFYAFNFRWFWTIFGFPAIALWCILGIFFALFCVLYRSLPETMSSLARAALAACFWVSVEFFRSEQWPLKFSWLALGYSQHNQPLALQLASAVGMYGISFLVILVSLFFIVSIRRRWFIVPLLFVLYLVVSPFAEIGRRGGRPDGGLRVIQYNGENLSRLKSLSGEGANRLIVWPEYSVEFSPTERPEDWARIAGFARHTHSTLVVGGVTDHGPEHYSSAAYVLDPQGKIEGTYEKHDPLPFFRDGDPGSAYPIFQWNGTPFGVTICYDLSFERNARILATEGAQFIVVPSKDDLGWGALQHAQHSMVAPLRAVENARWIYRSASTGESQIVSPAGSIEASLPMGAVDSLSVPRPRLRSYRTIYNRFGWLLPWLCQAVTLIWVATLAASSLRRRRGPQAIDAPLPNAPH